MEIIRNGLSVLSANWFNLLFFMVGPLGYGVWLARPFTRGQEHSVLINFTLAIPLGWVPMAGIISLVVVIGQARAISPFMSLILLIFSAALLGLWFWVVKPRLHLGQSLFILIVAGIIAFFCLVFRLAFIKNLLLPPYSDSLFHVQLSDSFLASGGLIEFLRNQGFYHFGIHALTAWASSLGGNDPVTMIALVGQWFIFASSLGVFALLLSWFHRLPEAVIGSLLSVFTWSFPAFTANWGKYPTLAAVALLPALFTVGALAFRREEHRTRLVALLVLTCAGSLIFHARLLVVYALILIVWAVDAWLGKIHTASTLRWLQTGLMLGALALLLLNRELATAYLFTSIPASVLLVITFPFLAAKPSRQVRWVSLLIIGILLLLSINTPLFLPGGADTLIDLPFAAAILFLPIAGWLVSGVFAFARECKKYLIHETLVRLVLLLGIFSFGLLSTHYSPDPCCDWARPIDLAAFRWMKRNLPADAIVYIAGLENKGRMAGVDAGLWINHQTGRQTNTLPFDARWFDPAYHADLCNQPPRFLYDSGLEQSFQIDDTSYPNWYQSNYASNGVTLLKILPCQN